MLSYTNKETENIKYVICFCNQVQIGHFRIDLMKQMILIEKKYKSINNFYSYEEIVDIPLLILADAGIACTWEGKDRGQNYFQESGW